VRNCIGGPCHTTELCVSKIVALIAVRTNTGWYVLMSFFYAALVDVFNVCALFFEAIIIIELLLVHRTIEHLLEIQIC